YDGTLVFPRSRDGALVLLGRKAKKVGAGRWNGYGGEIESNDPNPAAAAARELLEESGLSADPAKLEKVAIIYFHNRLSTGEEYTNTTHVYFVSEFEGTPIGTPEMTDPTWFEIDKVPYGEMIPSDREWLGPILNGKHVIAEAWLSAFQRESLQPVQIREAASDELET
ncbi:MAG TPA: NUDIX domain-containing protein, partial [Candidatus Paceibacterota bacterium]|nr:NUDIX domain-containing protein [Candidatus Paceibacterota bacterium]